MGNIKDSQANRHLEDAVRYMTGSIYPKYPAHLTKPNDPVNSPSHYTSHPSGIECIQITEHMNFCIGNVFKYCWRNGLKDAVPDMQDLKKARWYLNREIERLEKGEK